MDACPWLSKNDTHVHGPWTRVVCTELKAKAKAKANTRHSLPVHKV